MTEERARKVWSSTVLIGAVLMGFGLSALSIDDARVGQFDFIERHYDVLGASIFVGLVFLLAALIGWARLLNRAGRARIAKSAIFLPPAILVVAGASIGTNVHGVFPMFLVSMVPIVVIGVVVAIMAARAHE
jgi:hypothetical protein